MNDIDCDHEIEEWMQRLRHPLSEAVPEAAVPEYVHVEARVETLSDLIRLGEEATTRYDCTNPRYEFNIHLRGLAAAVDDLKRLDAMVGLVALKRGLVHHLLYYLQGLDKGVVGTTGVGTTDKGATVVGTTGVGTTGVGATVGSMDKGATVGATVNSNSQDYKHMVLTGPPGVGKTEVARLLGRIFLSMGVLTNGVFKKATRGDLIGGYLGQTAIKTMAVVQSCLGGVLFVDEAYSLWDPSREKQDAYAREAIDTLCEAMSFHRGELMVIFAGYPQEIDAFLDANRGMASRFLWRYHIDPYRGVEMHAIFAKMVHDAGWQQAVPVAWFVEREKKFTACGRDMEKLLTFAKVAHGHRLFASLQGTCQKRQLTEEDMERGYDQWLANQKVESGECSRHHFYFV